MKKITLLLFFLFISVSSYSQLFGLTEGFEDPAPSGPLPQTWSLATGNWAVFERNSNPAFGTGESWGINNFANGLQYQGSQCASVSREQINQGNTSEDFLATSIVSVPASGVTELHFWTRMFTSGNQGTIYKLMVASTAQSQTDPNAYVLVQQWTEADLILPLGNFDVWTEKTVTIPSFLQGEDVYFAFVREYTQPTSALEGDRWLVDNVGVNTQCTAAVTGTTTAITSTSATLNWLNPNNVGQWEIEVLTSTQTQGQGTIYSYTGTTPSYTIVTPALLPNTTYRYFIKAICSTGFSSPPSVVSANFTTQVAPPICGGNLVDSGGPTGNYSNNENVSTTVLPVTAGDVVTVTFTSFNTQLNTDFLKIYDGPNATFPLLANLSGTVLPPSFTGTSVSGALTFVFTSNGSTVAAGYAANITCGPPPVCRIPTGLTLTAGSVTTTSATISWIQPTNPDASTATQWQVLPVTPCTGIAPSAGATGFQIADSNTDYLISGLTPASCYDIWVRAVCGSGPTATTSAWSLVPVTTSTLVAPPVCGGNYVDTGGLGGSYANNENLTTVICPVTPGDAVTVTFTSFNTQANSDVLKIYNGDGVAGNVLLATLSGTTLPPSFTSSSSTGCLTFLFTSNGSTVAPGWVANVTCAPPPPCAKPIALSNGTATYNSVPLTWIQPANPDTSTPSSWQVLALPCLSPAPEAGATGFVIADTNTAFPLNGLASNTCFDIYVRSVCSGTNVSSWAGPITITTLIAPPICGGNFVDAGGVNADYANSSNVVTTICPTNLGDVVSVTFTAFNTEATWDGLYVYDGDAVSPATLLASDNLAGNVPGALAGSYWGDLTGALPGPFTATGTSGCLTFVFRSDGGGTRTGWISSITCGPPPACRKPSAFATSSITSNSVVLTWTQPINPDTSVATAWQVLRLPCGSPAPTAASTGFVDVPATGSPFSVTGLTPDTCYDFYIRAVCGPGVTSDWTGPKSIRTLIAPPACGGIFTDAGGVAGNYANNSNVTTIICPTNPTDAVTVTFTSFITEANWDGLYVYDGSGINPATLLPSTNLAGNVPGGLAGSYWGPLTGATLPGPFTSTSNDGCLTFVFRSDGSGDRAGWESTVTCSPAPNCPKPTNLYANQITATSAYLGWTEPTTQPAPGVTQWDVYYVVAGSPGPLPTTTPSASGVSINPALFTGLNPGTRYTFYVRSLCPTSGTSAWSVAASFTTLIINDDCSGAVFAPVNQSAICQQVTPGTLTAATASTPGPTAPCIGSADDDVWFQFVASNPYLNIALQNVVGTTTNLNFGVYTGVCGTLNQIFCSTANSLFGVINNLTIGQTYFIRVYSNANSAQTVNFDVCISTPSSCITGQAACQNLSYANIQGVINQPAIGCLADPRNPTYYTINVSTTGPINLLLTQSTTQGGAPNQDVDYAAWGPFASQAAACTAIGNPVTLAPGIGVPVTQTTGCSFSAASTETLNIVNAVAGQVYIILITNYANQPGFVSLTQTNFGNANAGAYQCCPDAYFTYNPVVYCKSSGAPNPVPSINVGSVAGTFSLSAASPAGLVFANSATGEIDLAASLPGNYLVLNTVAASPACPEKERGYNISIVAPTVAAIEYSNPIYCKSITELQTVTQTGTPGGVYSVSPNGGLFIDVATGAINPSLSSAGIYTITYSIPGTGICAVNNPSAQVEILPLPNILQPAAVVACNSATLQPLTVGTYYSQTGGVGPLDITAEITTSQTVYIYAVGANGCPNEKSFTITINNVAAPTYTSTVSLCTSPTGTITVETPIGTSAPIPANLFISEVTDATTGSLTYVEIFNATGAPVNLSNYKLRTFNNGAATFTAGCDNVLSGTLNNNATRVVSVGTATNLGGIVPAQTFAGCTGVNIDDCIKLTTLTNTVIDVWGRTDGVSFTPLGQTGYNYRRLPTATLPSTTFNPADWNVIDWTTTTEDYTNVGSYSLITSNYEYSIDNGITFQTGMVFNDLAPATYTLIVKDVATGCLSAPIEIIITALGAVNPVTSFEYPTPVCKNATTNPSPINFGVGFTTGGTYSEVTTISTGLVFINTSTGEIDLINSTSGAHTVRYSVPFNTATCQSEGSSDFEIIINPIVTPVIDFSYTTPICQNAQPALLSPVAPGLSSFATFSATPAGLIIDANTGVINLANSTPGIYDIIVTVVADSNTCRVGAVTSPAYPFEIKPIVTLPTSFSYNSPFCATTGSEAPIAGAGFTSGGTYSSTSGLIIDATTGVIDLTSTPGTYTVTYAVNPNVANCEVATPGTYPVTIVSPVTIQFDGGCQGSKYVLTALPINNSFDPLTATYSWENSQGVAIGTSQSIEVSNIGAYTVTVTVNGCPTKSPPFNVDSISCTIQKGISVNNDGLNDTFDLTGFNVKKLTIFNRLGMKVYARSNYVNEWGGKSDDGDDLPDGTYYFIIDRNSGETKTGWIYINRAQ